MVEHFTRIIIIIFPEISHQLTVCWGSDNPTGCAECYKRLSPQDETEKLRFQNPQHQNV